jgi:hypothetical protein
MMGRIAIVSICLLLILGTVSCSSTRGVAGSYSATERYGTIITRTYWKIRGESTLIIKEHLTLYKNGTFNYKLSTECLAWSYEGAWKLEGDTLRTLGFDSALHAPTSHKFILAGRKLKPVGSGGSILEKE